MNKRLATLRAIICLQLAALMAFGGVPAIAHADTASIEPTAKTSAYVYGKRMKGRTYKTKDFKVTVPSKWKGKWYKECYRGKINKSNGTTTYTFYKPTNPYNYKEYGVVFVCNSKKAAKKSCSYYAHYVGRSKRGKYVYLYSDHGFFHGDGNYGPFSIYAKVTVR